jgi:hypothetical protein
MILARADLFVMVASSFGGFTIDLTCAGQTPQDEIEFQFKLDQVEF